MQAALDLVRSEMGGDAVILHTRQIEKKRFLRRPLQEVEITAGLGVNVRPVTARSTARPVGRDEESARTGATEAKKPVARTEVKDAFATPPSRFPMPDDGGVEIAFSSAAKRAVAQTNAAASTSTVSKSKVEPSDEFAKPVRTSANATNPAARKSKSPPSVDAPRKRVRAVSSKINPLEAPRPTAPVAVNDPSQQFAARLSAIEKMLEQLGRTVRTAPGEDIPSELFQLYTELIDADMDDGCARELVYRLKAYSPAEQLADPESARFAMKKMIESELRCEQQIQPWRGRRSVVALVGATGVGKTTTLAKLAANFKLRDGLKVGLITVDTYRIAAVDQLRTYAEIIDLPMKVVTNPGDVGRALDELAGLDLVLIDTAGRSPRDDEQIQELKEVLEEARVDQVQLVLSLTSATRSLEQSIDKFAAVKPTGVILTKLDEAAGLGTLLSISQRLSCPISYVTTGQDVPDDIEPARAAKLAEFVLNGSVAWVSTHAPQAGVRSVG